jgi:peptidylprolyl isomerase/peptidyl-prolyl cis-trans isomerase B (cyclophilin B)
MRGSPRAWRLAAAACALACGLPAIAGCTTAGSPQPTAAASQTTTSDAGAAAPDLSSFGHLPPVPAPDAATTRCEYSRGGRAARPVTLPRTTGVATAGVARVRLQTNRGDLTLTLDRTESPCAVNSFVSLVGQRYFDDTSCHRLSVSTLRLLQCGDPSGTGRGGPGYTFPNEYPTTTYASDNPAVDLPVVYPRGTLAMANNGTPGTNGSQFFLVYGDSPIPPLFTVFGTVDATGLAVLDAVAAGGDDGSLAAAGGHPKLPVHITHAAQE